MKNNIKSNNFQTLFLSLSSGVGSEDSTFDFGDQIFDHLTTLCCNFATL